jgi:hypothetical protein
MNHSSHTARPTRWLMVACLVVAASTLDVAGCSSTDSTATDSGAGGRPGSGGHPGTGGGAADASVTHVISYTFDTSTQGWMFSTYPDPISTNLTGAYVVDGGADGGVLPTDAAVGDGGAPAPTPTLAFDGTIGQPTAGSLKITAAFTDCKQYVDPGISLAIPVNVASKMLHARLQVTSGTFAGGAQLHVTTGTNFAYAAAQFPLAASGTFGLATLDLSNPTGSVDPAQVVGIGIQIFTGDTCPYPGAGTPVVFNIDTITD